MRRCFSPSLETLIRLTPKILLITLYSREILVRLKEAETIRIADGSLNETNRTPKVAGFQDKPRVHLPEQPSNPGDRCSGTSPEDGFLIKRLQDNGKPGQRQDCPPLA